MANSVPSPGESDDVCRYRFDRKIDIPILTGLSLLPIVIIWSPYAIPGIGPAGIIRLDQILLPAIIILITYKNYPKINLFLSNFASWVFLVLISITASIIFGFLYFGYYISVSELFNILIWFTYAIFVVIVGAEISPRISNRIVLLIIFFSSAAAFFGLLQFLDLFGVNEIISPIFTYDPHLRTLGRRLTGPMINPNYFAQLLSLPLSIVISNILEHRKIRNDWYGTTLLFSAGLMGAALILTYSRTGLITAVAAVSIVVLLSAIVGRGFKTRRSLSFLFALIFSALILLVVFGIDRYAFLVNIEQSSSLQTRLVRWKAIVPLIQESVLFGHGPSAVAAERYQYQYVDSGLLNWWFEFGLFGVVAFVGTVGAAIVLSMQICLDNELRVNETVLWSTAVGIVGWSVGVLPAWIFTSVPYNRRAWTLFILLAMCLHSVRTKK